MQQREYVRRLLEAYRLTPGTCGAVRRPDRLLATQLHERGVPLEAVENALVLAAARRLMRPIDAAPRCTRLMAHPSAIIGHTSIARYTPNATNSPMVTVPAMTSRPPA